MLGAPTYTKNMAGSILFVLVAAAVVATVVSTPLDDYVNTPDPHYTFRYVTKFEDPGITAHVLNMTSQKWLNEEVTTNPIWWHFLYVIIPKKLDYTDSCFMWIDLGNNGPGQPKGLDDEDITRMALISESTSSVTALIRQVPNQPIVFQDDPEKKSRHEDSIIAWTWMKFLNNGSNPYILLRLPMTKAVVRGMDTVTSFVKDYTGNVIDKYVIGGESKRGWATWTTAAVDKRVVGMVPTVMDLLDIQKNLHHHYRSLGGWTFAFDDYYHVNITRDLDSPNMKLLQSVIDPLTYNDRYASMPKLIVTTGGDEFFLPDDSHYYYDLLKGPKYLRIIPNAEHSLTFHDISFIFSIRSFYMSVIENATLPTITWVREQTGYGGKITVKTSVKPKVVKVFQAKTTDDKRRDFRLAIKAPDSDKPLIHPVIWFDQNAKKISDVEYEFEMERPPTGWAAFFIQLTFDGLKNSTLEFTTEACIVPDVFPFPDCSGEACKGTLV